MLFKHCAVHTLSTVYQPFDDLQTERERAKTTSMANSTTKPSWKGRAVIIPAAEVAVAGGAPGAAGAAPTSAPPPPRSESNPPPRRSRVPPENATKEEKGTTVGTAILVMRGIHTLL